MNDPVEAVEVILLHGLGANAGVWQDVAARLAAGGPVRCLDLAGHGAAPWTGDYTLGALAAAASARIDPGPATVVVGHSLGGAVGLCLASGWFRPRVSAVVGLGIKLTWTDDDAAGMAAVADRGVRWFDTRPEAVERARRMAGLDAALVDDDHPALTGAVVTVGGRWRLAQDPRTFAQRPLDGAALLGAARCPVVLGAGADDTMVSAAELGALVDEPRIAPGVGHNLHVEDPDWVAALVTDVIASVGLRRR
ncbi:MAG: alpha/beta fold hydrolase [Acidimicrobiales bacterium]